MTTHRESTARTSAWRAAVVMLALVVAILGGLLAMHTMSADHGLDSSMTGMGHDSHAVAGSDEAQSQHPASSPASSSSSMAMLACILVLLTAATLVAIAPPSPTRPLELPVARPRVDLRSPGWGFSLPPPSLLVLSISRT